MKTNNLAIFTMIIIAAKTLIFSLKMAEKIWIIKLVKMVRKSVPTNAVIFDEI